MGRGRQKNMWGDGRQNFLFRPALRISNGIDLMDPVYELTLVRFFSPLNPGHGPWTQKHWTLDRNEMTSVRQIVPYSAGQKFRTFNAMDFL